MADVSVSFAGASTVATDTAAIVLMDGGLEHFRPLLDLSRDLDDNLRIGTGLSLAPGFACIAGVYLAGFGLVQAVLLYNAALAASLINAMCPILRENLSDHPDAVQAPPSRA